MKLTGFLGIDNITDRARLPAGALASATNVDIGASGELLHRRATEVIAAGAASSIYQAPFGLLALVGNDLVLLSEDGAALRVVYETLGYSRVWYVTLPDGRVGFSNGLVHGLATATTTSRWGVPTPASAGQPVAGDTQYQITYVRDADRLEGPPAFGELADLAHPIIDLPQLPGYSINVYAAPYGEAMFLLGTTAGSSFDPLGRPLSTQYAERALASPPPGTVMANWRARVLIAQGRTLWATQPFRPELLDATRDFVQLPADITGLFGSDTGVFVGTTAGLYFLSGLTFESLKLQQLAVTPVALGSMVECDAALIQEKLRPQTHQCALCLADGYVVMLYGSGEVRSLTAQRYRASGSEVHATVRVRAGVGQYIAAPHG